MGIWNKCGSVDHARRVCEMPVRIDLPQKTAGVSLTLGPSICLVDLQLDRESWTFLVQLLVPLVRVSY